MQHPGQICTRGDKTARIPLITHITLPIKLCTRPHTIHAVSLLHCPPPHAPLKTRPKNYYEYTFSAHPHPHTLYAVLTCYIHGIMHVCIPQRAEHTACTMPLTCMHTHARTNTRSQTRTRTRRHMHILHNTHIPQRAAHITYTHARARTHMYTPISIAGPDIEPRGQSHAANQPAHPGPCPARRSGGGANHRGARAAITAACPLDGWPDRPEGGPEGRLAGCGMPVLACISSSSPSLPPLSCFSLPPALLFA